MPKTKFTHSHSTLTFTGGMGVMTLREKTPYDTGFAAGTLLKMSNNPFPVLIRKRWFRLLLKFMRLFFRRSIRFLQVPESIRQELRGMAEGAEVGFDDLFVLNFLYDLQEYSKMLCSSFAVFPSAGALLMAHNTDLGSLGGLLAPIILVHAPTIVVNVAIDGKTPFVHVTHPCFVGSMNGFNAAGIGVTMHEIGKIRKRPQVLRTPGLLLARFILEGAKTMKDVEELVRAHGTYFPISLLVSSAKEKKSTVFEIYAGDIGRRVSNGEVLSCTNHFMSENMRDHHWRVKQGSLDRFKTVSELSQAPKMTVLKAIEILRDHRNGLQRDESGHSLSNSGTLESFVFDIGNQVIHIANGPKPPVALTGKFIEIPVDFT